MISNMNDVPGWVHSTCTACNGRACTIYHTPGFDMSTSKLTTTCKIKVLQRAIEPSGPTDTHKEEARARKRGIARAAGNRLPVTCNLCGLVMCRKQAGNHLRFKHDKTSWDLLSVEDFITRATTP